MSVWQPAKGVAHSHRALRVIQSAPDLCTQTRRLSAKDLLSDSVVLRGVPPNAEAPSAEILRAHSA